MAKAALGPDGMTVRQRRFVEAYLAAKDATTAARDAGYSGSGATLNVRAAQVLRLPRVRAEIERRQKDVERKTGVTKERVVREIEPLALSNIDNYVVGADGRLGLREGAPKNALRAVQRYKYRIIPQGDGPPRIEVEIALWDKLGALKTLGRHLGVFLPPPKEKEPDARDKVLDLFHEMLKARNERMRAEDDVRVVVHEIEAPR